MHRNSGGAALTQGLCIGLMLAEAGCSVLALRPPSTEPQKRKEALEGCKTAWRYPVTDTGSVVAGGTWLIGGFRDQSKSESENQGGASRRWATTEKIFGYSVIGLYGVSAVYGYYVFAKCHDLQIKEKAAAAARTASPSVRYWFPQNVLGFAFGRTAIEAQRACQSAHGAWDAATAQPVCHAAAPSLKEPDVRLELNLGTIQRVTLVYPVSRATLDRALRDVQQTAMHYYGPPQPPGTWRLPGGTIQLESVDTEERTAVELSFERAMAE